MDKDSLKKYCSFGNGISEAKIPHFPDWTYAVAYLNAVILMSVLYYLWCVTFPEKHDVEGLLTKYLQLGIVQYL